MATFLTLSAIVSHSLPICKLQSSLQNSLIEWFEDFDEARWAATFGRGAVKMWQRGKLVERPSKVLTVKVPPSFSVSVGR